MEGAFGRHAINPRSAPSFRAQGGGLEGCAHPERLAVQFFGTERTRFFEKLPVEASGYQAAGPIAQLV